MIRLLPLLGLFTIIALAVAQRSYFELCAHDYYNRDRPNECRVKKFQFDRNIPRFDNFIDCVFMGYRWVPFGSRNNVQTNKMISDLKANGFKNENDIQRVVSNCEKQHGKKIGSLDYFLCLNNDPKTKEGFMKWLKEKDGRFFQQC